MHTIFSILLNLANLEQNLEKSGGVTTKPTETPEKQINLTRNFMLRYKNSLKVSLFLSVKNDLF